MYSPFRLALKYARYYITASNGKGHGIHSPFVFDFVKNILPDHKEPEFDTIEELREKLLTDSTVIDVMDFGAGSAVIKTKSRVVNKIAASSLKSKKIARLLYRVVKYYKPHNIIELGTSFGITTAYLAFANKEIPVYSIEGDPAIAAIAQRNLAVLDLPHVHVRNGNFDDQLPFILKELSSVGYAYIDGNHRRQPTLNYFEQLISNKKDSTIIILDDIHWSSEMEDAWKIICNHPAVTLTIDLFFIGIVFFRTDFKAKQHFSIRF